MRRKKARHGYAALSLIALTALLSLLSPARTSAAQDASPGTDAGQPQFEDTPVFTQSPSRTLPSILAELAGTPEREVPGPARDALLQVDTEGLAGEDALLSGADLQRELAVALSSAGFFRLVYEGLQEDLESCRRASEAGCRERIAAEVAITAAELLLDEDAMSSTLIPIEEDTLGVFRSTAEARDFAAAYRERLTGLVLSRAEAVSSSSPDPDRRRRAEEALSAHGRMPLEEQAVEEQAVEEQEAEGNEEAPDGR